MDNRFEQLRYKSKLALNPDKSINQLAKELEISPATVSKLEHDENYDARISIIKKYKEKFPDVTYDYLLGATYTKHKQYNRIEETLPFGNSFYDKLEYFFKEHKRRRDTSGELKDYLTMDNLGLMLEAFLADPDKLLDLFETFMDALLYIRRVETGKANQEQKYIDYFYSGLKTKIATDSLEFIMQSLYPRVSRMLDMVIKEEDDLDEQIRLDNLPKPF